MENIHPRYIEYEKQKPVYTCEANVTEEGTPCLWCSEKEDEEEQCDAAMIQCPWCEGNVADEGTQCLWCSGDDFCEKEDEEERCGWCDGPMIHEQNRVQYIASMIQPNALHWLIRVRLPIVLNDDLFRPGH